MKYISAKCIISVKMINLINYYEIKYYSTERQSEEKAIKKLQANSYGLIHQLVRV